MKDRERYVRAAGSVYTVYTRGEIKFLEWTHPLTPPFCINFPLPQLWYVKFMPFQTDIYILNLESNKHTEPRVLDCLVVSVLDLNVEGFRFNPPPLWSRILQSTLGDIQRSLGRVYSRQGGTG